MDYDVHQQAAEIVAGIWQEDTLEQRLRAFLVARLGPGWQFCALQSHLLPSGQMVHVAVLPENAGADGIGVVDEIGISIFVIARDANSNFQLSPPSPVQDESVQARMPPLVVECLAQIGAALAEVTLIVNESRLKKRRKAWLVAQLSHAYRHLCEALKGE